MKLPFRNQSLYGLYDALRCGLLGARVALKSFAPAARERRLHLYGIGAPRTGTTKLASIFSANFRAAHEPYPFDCLRRLTKTPELETEKLRSYFVSRDRFLNLELEASHYLYYVTPLLVELFPRAKFIVTIRDCFSWLNSMINREVRTIQTNPVSYWNSWFNKTLGPKDETSATTDWSFGRASRYSIAGHLRYWSHHYDRVLSCVPDERLLLIKTWDLDRSIGEIADFCGITEGSLEAHGGRQNISTTNAVLANQADLDHLTELAVTHCGDLMRKFFPEIAHARDVIAPGR